MPELRLLLERREVMTCIAPPMAEVIALSKQSGMKCASTFSGAGGSCMGIKMAGFAVPYANEFIDAARAVRALNFKDEFCDGRDIREVTAASILDSIGLDVGQLDLFNGSPPCSAFSACGKRDEGWGVEKKYSDKTQRVDDLFFEFSRLLKELQPRAFVAENVAGLTRGRALGYYNLIAKSLVDAGYDVGVALLDAQWLGVPQTRSRTIFIGYRRNLGITPTFPKPLPRRYSIVDACPWLKGAVLQVGNPNHVQKEGNSFPRGVMVRATEPCPAILATNRNLGGGPHKLLMPDGTERVFTIPELMRLQTFPDDYDMGDANYARQWERVGRSVPPLMMRAIATHIRETLERSCAV